MGVYIRDFTVIYFSIILSIFSFFALSYDHAARLKKNCDNFKLQVLLEEDENCTEESELLLAVVKELCLLSEKIPKVKQRCIEIDLTLDRDSLDSCVSKLRYGM